MARWQRVGDLIDSKFKPHTSQSRRLLTTCAIWAVLTSNQFVHCVWFVQMQCAGAPILLGILLYFVLRANSLA